jgi:Domain of unknown function (DUF4383)
MALRIYCRVAAIAFILFTAYPSVVKIAEHRLAHDWAHGVLHLVSAAIGVYAGWFARTTTLAALYTWTIGVVYTVLGVGGWFIDGLLLGTPFAIPLGPADNVFHLLLGVPALALSLAGLAQRRSTLDPGAGRTPAG